MDKTERLLRMMEHPEHYRNEQWQELLSDEECRKLYEAMRLSTSAFEAKDAKQKIANGIKEKEWQKRKAEFFGSEKPYYSLFTIYYSLKKLVAMFVGLLMLSGIAYAAVQIAKQHQQSEASLSADTTAVEKSSLITHHSSLPQDSIPQVRIFENVPLDKMVSEIAHYYNKVVDIQSEHAHELRLYYEWEPQDAIESVVQDLNHFDRVNLALEDDKLIVKP